ncbi:MAG TPA: thioredoxin family protein [Candidatus Babeliales bacterium]|jgi:thioredoxin-like negative regulator of GroEL|nr:thioredoxin family protein [Candidatus Babeliales bacterium]
MKSYIGTGSICLGLLSNVILYSQAEEFKKLKFDPLAYNIHVLKVIEDTETSLIPRFINNLFYISQTKNVVLFISGECLPCQEMKPIIAQIKQELKDNYVFFELDTYKHRGILQYFDIQHIPSYIFFKNATIIGKEEGAMEKEEFEQLLQDIFYSPAATQREYPG